MEMVQDNQPFIRLSTLENGPILGAQCWSLKLIDWAFGHSALSLAKWPWHVWVHVVEPNHSLPCFHDDHFVHDAIGQLLEWLGRETDWNLQNRSFYSLNYRILLCWITPWRTFPWDTNVLLPHSKRFIYIPPSPDLLAINFPIVFLPRPLSTRKTTRHSSLNGIDS